MSSFAGDKTLGKMTTKRRKFTNKFKVMVAFVLHQAVPAAQPEGHAPQLDLVDRYNLCTDGTWSHVSGGHHRCVQPPHPVVEAGQHFGLLIRTYEAA